MRVIITAGPTREHIDSVRFITNASSGRMGCAVAEAAVAAGHEVTLVLASGIAAPAGCRVVRFTTVEDLARALNEHFGDCDWLMMAAAVGDFRPERKSAEKLSRDAGPITLRLVPVGDIVAGLGRKKRPGQKIVAFAVEDGPESQIEAAARKKLAAKNADYIVANTAAAMAAEGSHACILAADGVALPWADRPKRQLAEEIVKLL